MKRIVLSVVLALCMVFSLTGCLGPEKPTAEDATGYVQAVLDLVCTGDYDHSVTFDDIEEGKEMEMRDQLIREGFQEGLAGMNLSEEMQNGFFDYFVAALAKAKYTVGDAQAADDGGFDVTVTMEPLKLFNFDEGVLEEKAVERAEELASMSEEEMNEAIMGMVLEVVNQELDNPQYAEPQEITVHYGMIDEENNEYGLNDEESEKLFEGLFLVEDAAEPDAAETE